jgi:quinohemoprotein ethanol dehydrogenase
MVCHGAGAVGGGVVPDLRKSVTIADKDTWKSIVYDGILKDRGMVGFSSVMDETQADNIRAYVIGRAEQAEKDDAAITAK